MVYNIPLSYKMRILETQIRNMDTSKAELCQALIALGHIMGDEILGQSSLTVKDITTPQRVSFTGVQLQPNNGVTIVFSTKDDYSYFAQGIAAGCSTSYRGYIDFGGMRGTDVYRSSYRSIEFPIINPALSVNRVIIAKSVIASGCTAISLAKAAIEKYDPDELIIAAPFYCEQGIMELQAELKRAKMFVAFGPDELDADGMLVPGVGNIDARLAV